MNNKFEAYLSGGDLRSFANVAQIINCVQSQERFDELFHYLCCDNRLWVMRAADAIEKITKIHPDYLKKHKAELFTLLEIASNKELKWHLALLLPRLCLSSEDCIKLFCKLSDWAMDNKESKIVRVNCLQGLFELAHANPNYEKAFQLIVLKVRKENIPSINARIRRLIGTKVM